MRIAGALCVKDYKDFGTFEMLKELCDHVIVIDDVSQSSFPYTDQCDDYIRLERKGGWHDFGNWMLAFSRAYIANCEWVLRTDDDIIHPCINRPFLEKSIVNLTNQNKKKLIYSLKDVWEKPNQYRDDGLWGCKTYGFFYRNYFFDKYIKVPHVPDNYRLHCDIIPESHRGAEKAIFLEDKLCYHFGCYSKEDREKRIQKYSKEDPDNKYQFGYDYIGDESLIELKIIPSEHVKEIKEKAKHLYENSWDTLNI